MKLFGYLGIDGQFFMKPSVSAEYLYFLDFGNMNFELVKCLRRQKKDLSSFHLGNGFPVVYNSALLGLVGFL